MNEATISMAKQFLSDNRLGTLSTLSSETAFPQSVVVYYVFEGDYIYFVTAKNSQKIRNIQKNKQIALCVFDKANLISLQIEGEADINSDEALKTKIPQKILEVVKSSENTFSLPPVVLLSSESGIAVVRIKLQNFKYSIFIDNRTTILAGNNENWQKS